MGNQSSRFEGITIYKLSHSFTLSFFFISLRLPFFFKKKYMSQIQKPSPKATADQGFFQVRRQQKKQLNRSFLYIFFYLGTAKL
jgi:fucose permease